MKKDNERLSAQRIEFADDNFRIFSEKREFCKNDRAFHEELEIKYYLSGNSAVMIDGEVFVTSPGSITVVNPFEIHANANIGDYAGEYILLMVGLDFLKEFAPGGLDLRHYFITKGRKITHFIRDDRCLSMIMQRICDELRGEKENYRLVVYSLVTELFALLLRDHTDKDGSREEIPGAGKAAELIAPALSAIFENYSRPMSLDELAALCSISKYHFCRLFKEEMKMTVVQYLTDYRISLAEVLLRESDKSVDSIALECGFSDISYFYRCYRRIKGTSPKRARRK